MPDMPLPAPGFVAYEGSATATAAGSTNTKGSYTTVVASTSMDATGILISSETTNVSVSHLIDIAIGAAASEVVVLPNWLMNSAPGINHWIYIPVNLPAGSRISVRNQGSTASAAIVVAAHLVRGSLFSAPNAGRIVDYGTVTATSFGTSIDPGAVANTYGSWTQITASTTEDISAIYLQLGHHNNSAPQLIDSAGFRMDIGVGAAASEVLAWGPISFGSYTNGAYGPMSNLWFPISIPAGVRLSVRARTTTTDATDRKFDIAIYALAH